jgi:AraC-like DNA-binding protein
MSKLLSVARIGPYQGSRSHTHDCWEIGFYLDGRGVAVVGNNQVPFSRGTVICYPPFIPHSEQTKDACFGFFITANHCPFGESALPLYTDRSRANFLRLISLLHHEWREKGAQWENATEHLFSLLLIHLRRQCSFPRPSHPLVDALRHEIEKRITDPDFHAGSALARLPMSPDHLRRLFARETGSSPLVYLKELRIAKARQLSREGRWRVKEVAAQVGIQDEYYFSRLFLKHTGQRPLDYRRSVLLPVPDSQLS